MLMALPNWPALMDPEMAAAYCTLKEDAFKALAAKYGVSPRDLGGIRGVRYRRGDLDQLIDKLPARGEASPEPANQASIHDAHDTGGALARVRSRARRAGR